MLFSESCGGAFWWGTPTPSPTHLKKEKRQQKKCNVDPLIQQSTETQETGTYRFAFPNSEIWPPIIFWVEIHQKKKLQVPKSQSGNSPMF